MIARRRVLAGGAAALAGSAIPMGLRSTMAVASAPAIRIGSLKFGTLSWLLDTIKAEGLDAKAGVKIDVVDVATNQAGPIALIAGEADVIVSDWTWAMRQRSEGEDLKFSPYNAALGALMVPKGSPIKSLADLKGKRLGVAGSAIDKSWLLLRAHSRKTLGQDIAELATPVFGAAPLITEELKGGRLDAALTFWTFAARLKGQGYTEVLDMQGVMRALGIDPVPPLVGFVWREKVATEKALAFKAFFEAVGAASKVLASSDAAWERLRPMVKPAADAELTAIRDVYRAGIGGPWGDAQTRAAETLMALLVELGDKELVGPRTRFDAKLFHAPGG